jgi:hypothetical protein
MKLFGVSVVIVLVATAVSLSDSVAAFAMAHGGSHKLSNTALRVTGFEDELGVQKPLGFWDPLSVCDGADQARFDELRYVEIKHGRIAMLAIVGHMVTSAGVRWPGSIGGVSYSNIPAGLAAFERLPTSGLAAIFVAIGFLEVVVMKDSKGVAQYPGDLRNGLFQWSATPEEQLEKRAIELNNGRAAQMGILALMVHEKLNNEPYMINSFLGYSSHFNENF